MLMTSHDGLTMLYVIVRGSSSDPRSVGSGPVCACLAKTSPVNRTKHEPQLLF